MPPMPFRLDKLNPQQREAVARTEGPVLILAGAGTGKTRVITSRITHMIERGVNPAKILAVTFTNKAANEMRERVAGMVKREAVKQVWISTFHSLCVRILRRSIERLGYKRNFTIYSDSEQIGLLRRIITRTAARDEKLEPRVAQAAISQAKNKGGQEAGDEDELVAEVARRYQREMKSLNAVDFDDLLVLAAKLLREFPDDRRGWQRRFDYMMVDEFQDTNSLQMELLRHLTGEHQNVCVVGDDDQSIYGWRGADISNILDFERHFSNPHVVKLEENYRSTTPILETANSLIRHNKGRREKQLWSRREGSETIRLIAMPNEDEEAALIVSEICDAHMTRGRKWEDFAVLFRMNTQSRLLEEGMRKQKIPYRVIGGQSFYERREVKDVLAWFTVLLNPDDDVSLLRIVSRPPRGIGNTTLSLAMDRSIAAGQSLFATLRDPSFQGGLSGKARGAISRFVQLMDEMREAVTDNRTTYAQACEHLIETIGYVPFLKRDCKTDDEAASRELNVREVIGALFDHQQREKSGLREFLDNCALNSDKDDDKEKDEDGWGVSLITLHASKGLEFPVVYLIGVEEGVLPHSRSIEEGSREEERRLLYVGITRAMRSLTISWCQSRKRYGQMFPGMPSSFLDELSPEHIEEVSHDTLVNEPASEETAANYFERMRSMLRE